MHPDHIFGNAAFAGGGVTFVGHKNLPRAIATRQDFYISSYTTQLGGDLMAGMQLVPPTLLVSDRLTLDLGNRRIALKAWPAAHTDNDLTVFDEASATLIAGDLLFCQHVPIVDGSLKGWLAILPELRASPATSVIPGHGPAPQPWPEALAPQQRYLEALAADIRKAIAQGTSLADAVKTIAQGERGNWQLFDEYHARNVTAGFSELEWE
jgi:quinoprotein relay system zinc metallohydrolase 2